MTNTEMQAKIFQDAINNAWVAAHKNRPIYKKLSKKLDARWDRLNDFTVTEKFDELTDKQQKAVFDKMNEIANKLDCIEAILYAIENIMNASDDLDCALAELVE